MKRILVLSALIAVTSAVSGCGLRGKLERPAPMWGEERERWEAAQQAGATAEPTQPQRPRVEIPVEGASTTSADGTTTSDTDGEQKEKPLIQQSKGALPPVQGATSSAPYSNY